MVLVFKGIATHTLIYCVAFEALTAAVMKDSAFQHITPFIPLKINQRFGGTYRLHLQDRRIRKALLATSFIFVSCSVCSSELFTLIYLLFLVSQVDLGFINTAFDEESVGCFGSVWYTNVNGVATTLTV
jgi:hypothetical protein